MKQTSRPLNKVIRLTAAVFLFVSFSLVGFAAPKASAQTCGTTTTPATTYGQVTQSVTVATAGTYRVWSRIKAPSTTNNSYYFQVDGGCAINVGDATSIPANTWTWVSYQGGNTASFADITLTAGAHTLKYTGKEADVQLDRVLLLGDLTCVPTGTGDNCAVTDTTAPTTSITAPASGTSVVAGSTVTVNATASDNVGVAKVEFYVDGALKSTDTVTPYSYAWNTTGVAAGAHSLTTRAYDAANNTATSVAVGITVTAAPVSDTTPPTVSLTAPTAGASATVGSSVTISVNASDNVAVTKVEFYQGTTMLNSDTATPYSYIWSTTGVTAGTKSLTAKAYDAAGNVTTSTAVSLNLTAPNTGSGDANNDTRVNSIDLSILLSHDGQNYPAADFNNDGTVGAADMAILISKWTW